MFFINNTVTEFYILFFMIILFNVRRVLLRSEGNSVAVTNFQLHDVDVKLNKFSHVTSATSKITCCKKCARTTGCASVSFNADEKLCLLSEELTLESTANFGWKTYIDTADDCIPEPCLNGATCTDALGTFTCTCVAGWEGRLCETDINECSDNPCLNSGTCVDHVGFYTCNCLTGYTGIDCASVIDYCLSSPCVNGDCNNVIGLGTYVCTCYNGYNGENCATDIDECTGSPCLNGAVCTNHVGDYSCACATGYYGSDCGTSYCDPGWYYFDSSCYYFVDTRLIWDKAESYCENVGAHLIDITSADEHEVTKYLYMQYHPNNLIYSQVWIGAHRHGLNDEFQWTDRTKIDDGYTNWDVTDGQPDNWNGGESCGSLRPWRDFLWNDDRCSSEYLSICEKI